MAGSSGGAIDTGGGGLDAGSSAAARSGEVKSGNRAYGGINIAPAQNGFSLSPMTIAIGVGVTGLFFYAKRKKWI